MFMVSEMYTSLTGISQCNSLLMAGESRVLTLLKSKEEELHRVSVVFRRPCRPTLISSDLVLQLASALMEHETLDVEEVKKVIKGEPIRNIKEVIQEDLSRLSEEPSS